MNKFTEFLHKVETEDLAVSETATSRQMISQSLRNQWRKAGVDALYEDLKAFYPDFDIVQTKDGIVLVAENEPGDFTVSWELKSSIKNIDYDPFIEAGNYEVELEQKAVKKESKRIAEEEKAKRRQKLTDRLNGIE